MVSWLSEEAVADRYPGIVLPAFHAIPDVEFTRGPTVAKVAAATGLVPDPQQQLALDIVFAVVSPEDMRSLVFSLCLVVGRQVMKSAFFEMVLLGWLFVTMEQDVTYSAHETKTAAAIYNRLAKRIKETPQLAELLPMSDNRGCYSANGQMRIELADERQVEFVTRTEDASRGLGKNKLILDEAYAIAQAFLDALLPTVLARPDPQLLYASMAGKARSEALRSLRDDGRGRADEDLAYLEWCAAQALVICDDGDKCAHLFGRDPGCGFEKEWVRRQALPAYGARLQKRTVDNLRKRLSPAGAARELFGWWDKPIAVVKEKPAFDVERWGELEDIYEQDDAGEYLDTAPPATTTFGIEVDVEIGSASIGTAGRRDDGRMHLEHVDGGRGDDWIVPRCVELARDHAPAVFVVDGGGPAAPLIKKLREAGLQVEVLDSAGVVAASAAVMGSVNKRGSLAYVHGPQPELEEAVASARQRPVGERGTTVARRKSGGDVTPIQAAMWAAYAADLNDYDVLDSAH